MSDLPRHRTMIPASLAGAGGWVFAGTLSCVMFAQAVLEDLQTAQSFASRALWLDLVEGLGGEPELSHGQITAAVVPWAPLALIGAALGVLCWLLGAVVVSRSRNQPFSQALADWGFGWKWWCLPGVWYLSSLIGLLGGWSAFTDSIAASVDLLSAVALAGWVAKFLTLIAPDDPYDRPVRIGSATVIAVLIALYAVAYTWMNWQLYAGLLLPHGDSAMYEEHLWNVTHGKGFRSYLDQGLFLGEHIQFIHLALLPVYVFWPSHLLLELCESLALASTALPVFWIARRHTGSERVAVWMAAGCLLYFPLHYLDIAIDLKTFRPISFGVPLLLFAIDQMERRRWKTTAALLLVTLTAKEDFAIVIAPLGLWMAASSWWNGRQRGDEQVSGRPGNSRNEVLFGLTTSTLAAGYLLLAVKILIPWFRDGETVHYARYFSRFGETPTEIVVNMLTDPGMLLGELLTLGTVFYALRILIPLGGTPLLSLSRLSVGAPLFALLCLNELAQETPAPVHHFHAPLLPVVFWAAAAGLGRFRRSEASLPDRRALWWARFGCLCALGTGFLVSNHPLTRKFWDSADPLSAQNLFIPGERAERFAEIYPLIPLSARVASTDFVHPRFTHHERSYDYSDYLRKVAGYEKRVPADTEYIVIDTRHPYSTMRSPSDVPEYHRSDEWELLTTEPDPWFIVLRRRSPDP